MVGGVGSALVFLLLTYPLVTLWFRRPGGRGRSSLLIALAVVAVAVSIKVGMDMRGDTVNHYKTLSVGRHSSPIDVRKAYKQISRVLHPDKNPSPNAEAEFQRVKTAYDVLMDEKQRDVYNRFGADSLSFDPRHDELKLLSSIGAAYIFWLVAIFVTTVPSGSHASRTWASLIGIGILVLEVCMCLTETAIPSWFPSHLTEAELIMFLHRIFPGIIVTLRCISESFYVDVDDTSMQFLLEMEQQHTSMRLLLRMLKSEMAGSGGSSSNGGSSNGGRSVSNGGDVAKSKEDMTAKIDEVSATIDESSAKRGKLVELLKGSVNDPVANYYWLVLVFMYGAMYLSSGSEEEAKG